MARFGNRPRGLIKVETDEGLYGWGEAYSTGPDLSVEPIADYIFEMIQGDDPRRIEYIMLKLHQQFRFPPRRCWTRCHFRCRSRTLGHQWESGRLTGIHAPRWTRSRPHPRLPVALAVGMASKPLIKHTNSTRIGDSPLSKRVLTNSIPMQIAGDVSAMPPLPILSQIRNNTPADWEFAFDPHAKIFEPIRALQLANALAPYDPYFYEEPLRPEHMPAWARLRAQDASTTRNWGIPLYTL